MDIRLQCFANVCIKKRTGEGSELRERGEGGGSNEEPRELFTDVTY